MDDFLRAWRARPLATFLAVAGIITAFRIFSLFTADANLGPDEAQYWDWSRSLAFGYFSKPPLIAWTIAATTGMFGDGEWAIRLSAPLYHFGAAIILFALGRKLYGEAVGFWAGLGWLTLPGVTLSSSLMTTDAPLIFFWSAALYFFVSMAEARGQGRPTLAWSVGLGLAIGLGFLAKYATIYFLVGAALSLVVAKDLRQRLRLADIAPALVLAALVLSPNIVWNAQNDFQTVSHTAANADWGRGFFHVDNFLEFLSAQFGVFGPIPLLLLIWGCAALARRERAVPAGRPSFVTAVLNPSARLATDGARRGADLALLAFALPPIIIIAAQAFISRAHANWAAVAYPSAIVLVTAWAFRAKAGALIRASAALHIALAIGFIAAFSNFAIIDALGLSAAVKRVRGWEEQGAFVRDAARGYDAILIDDRELMATLLYYARGGPPMFARDSNNKVESHYEAFRRYNPAAAPRVLFVDLDRGAPAVAKSFAHVEFVGETSADLKRGQTRALYLFAVSGYGEKPAKD